MERGVSVVIPNYNGRALLPETLPTVFAALEHLGGESEVIIADDCSTDDALDFVQKNYPSVRIVINETNSGFSVTANRGMKEAKYPLILLLNSDVKLEKDYFDHQLRYFDDPSCFGVMGRIIGWDDDRIQDGAKYPSFQQAKIKTSVNYLLKEERSMDNGLFTVYLSGANALLDREKVMRLGGFNELFSPFYSEDYELSLRAWRLGYKCFYDHRSVCRHRTSTTIKSKSSQHYIRKISNRNKWFLHAIHLSPSKRFTWFVQVLAEIIGQSLLVKTYYLQAFALFLSGYGEVKRSRARLSQLAGSKRLLSVDEVADTIRESIRGKEVKFF